MRPERRRRNENPRVVRILIEVLHNHQPPDSSREILETHRTTHKYYCGQDYGCVSRCDGSFCAVCVFIETAMEVSGGKLMVGVSRGELLVLLVAIAESNGWHHIKPV